MSVRQLSQGGADGTKLGQSATDKVGFWGATPVVQPAVSAAVATTGATQTTPFGFTTAAQPNNLIALVNEMRAALVANGILR